MNPEIIDDLTLAQATAEAVQPFSTAYLVHDTAWGVNYLEPLRVYLSRHEAEVARDAAEKMSIPHAGWTITPFRHDSTLGATVRLHVSIPEDGQPHTAEVSLVGRVVAEVYQSDLPY